jgi:hypothetical protein
MAYIPDDAIVDGHVLTPTARALYYLICMRRNRRDRYATIRVEPTADTLRVSKSQFYRAKDELVKLGWITTNRNIYVPIYGDFTPHDRTEKRSHRCDEDVAPTRQKVAPTRRKVAPVRNDVYISTTDEPWLLTSAQSSSVSEPTNDLDRWMPKLRPHFPDTDPRILEIAICQTVLRRDAHAEPIRSEKYFFPEIEKLVPGMKLLGPDATDALHQNRLLKLFTAQGG